MKAKIIYEDNDILVCHKPAGLATQTGKVGEPDLVSEIKNYLGNKPYLGLVHRLDQPVEGLLVFAKTASAAKDLSRQLTNSILNKQYVAIVFGKGFRDETILENDLLKDNKTNMSKVAGENESGAKKAKLLAKMSSYNEEQNISQMEITLFTGRHHQIRVQLANAGLPLLGDGKYGTEESIAKSKELGVRNVALCAKHLTFLHPKTKKTMEFHIEPEGEIFRKI